MKGGVACMVFAAEVLAALGVRLAGDLTVNTVSEEESTGAGGLAMARELRADAAIVPGARRLSASGSRAAAASCRRSRSRAARATPASRRAIRTTAGR